MTDLRILVSLMSCDPHSCPVEGSMGCLHRVVQVTGSHVKDFPTNIMQLLVTN